MVGVAATGLNIAAVNISRFNLNRSGFAATAILAWPWPWRQSFAHLPYEFSEGLSVMATASAAVPAVDTRPTPQGPGCVFADPSRRRGFGA